MKVPSIAELASAADAETFLPWQDLNKKLVPRVSTEPRLSTARRASDDKKIKTGMSAARLLIRKIPNGPCKQKGVARHKFSKGPRAGQG
jgi:hypothetical protein